MKDGISHILNEYETISLSSILDDFSVWSSMTGMDLLNNIPVREYRRIIDIGTGTGFPIIELAQRFNKNCEFVGIDKWDKMIDIVKRKCVSRNLKNILLIVGDFKDISLKEDSFDLVVSNNGFTSSDYRLEIIQKSYKILKKGGEIHFTAMSPNLIKEFYTECTNCLLKLRKGKQLAYDIINKKEKLRKDEEYYIEQLNRAGFLEIKSIKQKKVLKIANLERFMNYAPIKMYIMDILNRELREALNVDYEKFKEELYKSTDKIVKEVGYLNNTIEYNIFSAKK